LISGETGVGKELIARSVHELSGVTGEFIAVNVAGLDDNMFSDTLFGHKKGAYTGAIEAREGLIIKAARGTLFLDEIGDLNELSQIKLLRLLQEGIYFPLGSDIPKDSDTRIVTATNQNLQKLIVEGKFRKDLFYRLCAHQIHISPLRERIEDLPLLLDHNLKETSNKMNIKVPAYPPELLTLLSAYHFPGNIRELQTLVLDAVARHKSGILSMESFRQALGKEKEFSQNHVLSSTVEESKPLSIPDRFPTLKEVERYLISEALKRSNGNQGIAADLLGIQRKTLNKRLSRKESSS
jgi:transcriptional regulator with PAS, ATPase and Fis domain